MGTSETTLPPLTLKQKFLLGFVVPFSFLVILEITARVLLFVRPDAPKKEQPTQLEMPTWMLQDANALARKKPSAAALDWLHMFVSGDGYRVHLIPNSTRDVQNTFSLIPADEERRYRITSNSLGFRSPELPKSKGSNVFRIAIFGDSSSFGWGVNYDDSWGSLLQHSLQASANGKKIEVVNFAIPGDSSAYGSLLFQRFAPITNADLFILGFGANDAKPVLTSHTQQVSRFKNNSSLLSITTILKYSALVRLLESTVAKIRTVNQEPSENLRRVPAVTLSEYASNLSSMASKGSELGAKNTLLLTLCTPSNSAKRARSVARQNRLLFFNGQSQLLKALPDIRTGKLYPDYVSKMKVSYPQELANNKLFYITSDGCHPNELGHRFVSDRLTPLVTPLLEK
jgi:lysophospholipase L1-like esterase